MSEAHTPKDRVAIIPARGGSKGVPRKNIKPLGGFPLIAYTVAACRMSKETDRVIVSTDDKEIAEIAKQYGAEVPFLRPAELATDGSTDLDFVRHAMDWFSANEGYVPKWFIHMRPTTPLRDAEKVDEAIRLFLNDTESTSLRSAHKASESPFKWFLKNEKGYFESIVEGISNERINGARQSFPDVYIPDGYVDVISTGFVKEQNILHGVRMLAYESPYCTEVDTEDDFRQLEYELLHTDTALYRYMNEQFADLKETGETV